MYALDVGAFFLSCALADFQQIPRAGVAHAREFQHGNLFLCKRHVGPAVAHAAFDDKFACLVREGKGSQIPIKHFRPAIAGKLADALQMFEQHFSSCSLQRSCTSFGVQGLLVDGDLIKSGKYASVAGIKCFHASGLLFCAYIKITATYVKSPQILEKSYNTGDMDSQVQDIKDKLNIAEIIGNYVKLERAGRTMRARCPFHKEKTASFYVSPERGTYKCFGCGEGGDIFTFIEKVEGVEFPEALRQLAEKAGITLERRAHQQTPEQKDKHERLYDVCEAATSYFQSVLAARPDVQTYLAERGVTPETITAWRLGYAPASWEDASKHLHSVGFSKDEIAEAGLAAKSEKKPGEVYDRFRGRIMFPIADQGGRVIAFSGRYFQNVAGTKGDDEPAKYVNSPETPLFKKSRALFGYDKARHAIRKADCVLLVEGQFDVVLCNQSGLPFTVALSGTALTPEHLAMLGRVSKRLVLALDADAAGIRSGLKSAEMALAAGFDVKIPRFPEGKDPADIARANPDELKAFVRNSKTAIEFFLDVLHMGVRDERDYKHVVETSVLPLIAAVSSKIDQAHFVHVVAGRLGVPESAVFAELLKRPKTPASNFTTSSVQQVPNSIQRTPQGLHEALPAHERAAAMLLYHFAPDSPEVQKLTELFGAPRIEALLVATADQAESLRFAFDAMVDEEGEAVRSMIQSAERGVIDEDLRALQVQLRTANSEESQVLLKRLSELKRRQEGLRK
jgi:DNA primase